MNVSAGRDLGLQAESPLYTRQSHRACIQPRKEPRGRWSGWIGANQARGRSRTHPHPTHIHTHSHTYKHTLPHTFTHTLDTLTYIYTYTQPPHS